MKADKKRLKSSLGVIISIEDMHSKSQNIYNDDANELNLLCCVPSSSFSIEFFSTPFQMHRLLLFRCLKITYNVYNVFMLSTLMTPRSVMSNLRLKLWGSVVYPGRRRRVRRT